MDRKYDINKGDDDDDFESTHRDLERYVRGNEQINAGLGRLVWERKLMRRFQKLERRVANIEDNQHTTVEIAAIAQREIGPARKFVDAIIHWRHKIVTYAISAAVTGAVTWFLATHGVK